MTQAADEFQKSHKSLKTSSGGESRTTLSSTAKKQQEDVINIMERANLSMTKKGPGLNRLPVVGKSKPVKPIAQTGNAVKPQINQSDKEQLSQLVLDMSEESKRQEARNFDHSKQ